MPSPRPRGRALDCRSDLSRPARGRTNDDGRARARVLPPPRVRAARVLSLHVVAFFLAAGLPFLPFVVANPGSVYYAMFGVYLKVMKGFVWYSTTWTQNTYGLTGRLLERGLERYVEAAQVASLAVTYILSWRSLRMGGRPSRGWHSRCSFSA